jgi:hypothetical protein
MKDQEGFNREILSDVQAERTRLKALLLTVTKERDALADEQCGSECVKAHGELAELRKQLGEAEKWIGIRKDFQWSYIDTDYARELMALASPPSLAPVESKPDPYPPDKYPMGPHGAPGESRPKPRPDCGETDQGLAHYLKCPGHDAADPAKPSPEKL